MNKWGKAARVAVGALLLAGLTPVVADVPMCGTAFAQSCCKTCRKGKACGDSCIARHLNCTRGAGCACNG